MAVIKNQPGGRVAIRTVNTTDTIVVAGNTSVSNIASTGETVVSASIGRIYWTGACTVARGGTTVFSALVNTSGTWDLASAGMAFNDANTANVIITATAATVVVELTKNPQSGGA